MEQTVAITLKLPKELSLELDRKLIDMRSKGIRITKTELVIEAIKYGLKKAK